MSATPLHADDWTLSRSYLVNPRPRSLAEDREAQRSETITGHPPIPSAAVARLRLHLTGHPRAGDDGRIAWHHASGHEWAAVLDLHRGGDDTAATELAIFLRWVEARGNHADHTCWVLTPRVTA